MSDDYTKTRSTKYDSLIEKSEQVTNQEERIEINRQIIKQMQDDFRNIRSSLNKINIGLENFGAILHEPYHIKDIEPVQESIEHASMALSEASREFSHLVKTGMTK